MSGGGAGRVGGDGEGRSMCENLGGIDVDWVGNCGGVWGNVGVRVRSRMRDREGTGGIGTTSVK